MIDIKPSEEETLKLNFTEEQKQAFKDFIARHNNLLLKGEPSDVSIIDADIAKELHELNKTLKEILREMRKRKE